jgi:hypothetical protein
MSALNGYEFVVKDGKILGEPFVMEEEFDLDHEISLIK